MTARQLEAACYVVLGLGAGMTLVTVAYELASFDPAQVLLYGWMGLPYGLATTVVRWLRTSAAALGILLVISVACAVGGSWVVVHTAFFVVSDTKGLVLFAPPLVQVPVVLIATLGAWWLRRHER